MPRYKLTIEYDGTDFSGWQVQPNARTIEQVLEGSFQQILQQQIDLVGQGRTDAGVHARGQTAHVDLPAGTDLNKLLYGVNGLSGNEIQVTNIEKVSDDFHARFDATSRAYEYTITRRVMPLLHHYTWAVPGSLEISKMHECAALLNGEHDFAGFSKFNEDNYTTICNIQRAEFKVEGEIIRFQIQANRFLRNMVRRLVGTMVRIAEGKITVEDFQELLENPDAEIITFTAPAKALVLQKVFYKN